VSYDLEKLNDDFAAKEELIKRMDAEVLQVQQRLEEAEVYAPNAQNITNMRSASKKEHQMLQIRERELKSALSIIQGDLEILNGTYTDRKKELQVCYYNTSDAHQIECDRFVGEEN